MRGGDSGPVDPRSCAGSRGQSRAPRQGHTALLSVHCDADSPFEDFAWETATSLKKKRGGERREQVSKDLKVTGYLPSVFILQREGVR